MKNALCLMAGVLLVVGSAQATVTIEMVSVGDAGNAADTTGYGDVDYNYNIGKYDVTVDQYVEFMNYKEIDKSSPLLMPIGGMTANHIELVGDGSHLNPFIFRSAAGYGNNPVSYVSYWNACRFVNWLNNGQGDGDTESGAYALDGYNGSDGGAIGRNSGAQWVIPTIDEWYKAAFYNGTDYYDYPTVSAYGAVGMYGLGTGLEWSESVSYVGSIAGHIVMGDNVHGSSLGDPSKAGSPITPGDPEPVDHGGFEFRVVEIPEPATMLLLASGAIALRKYRR